MEVERQAVVALDEEEEDEILVEEDEGEVAEEGTRVLPLRYVVCCYYICSVLLNFERPAHVGIE